MKELLDYLKSNISISTAIENKLNEIIIE